MSRQRLAGAPDGCQAAVRAAAGVHHRVQCSLHGPVGLSHGCPGIQHGHCAITHLQIVRIH